MNQQQKKELQNAAHVLADQTYSISDYNSESELEQGLALTHEQVSDNYAEGTSDAQIEDYAGKHSLDIPHEGYEGMFADAKQQKK